MKLWTGAVLLAGIAFTGIASAKTCDITIEGNDAMKFTDDKKANLTEIKVAGDCTDVKLTLKHVGKLPKAAMGHNVVITKTADKDAVLADGIKAGIDKNYVTEGDKIVAHTTVVGGGESDTVSFSVKKLEKGAGKYVFVCTFPGHAALMTGAFVVEAPAAGSTAKATKKK